MDNRKNTILLTVIAVATLLVAVVGATFAYFTAQGGTGDQADVNVQTETTSSTAMVVNGSIFLHATPDNFDTAETSHLNSEDDAYATVTWRPSTAEGTDPDFCYTVTLNITKNDIGYDPADADEDVPELLFNIQKSTTDLSGNRAVQTPITTGIDELTYATVEETNAGATRGEISGWDVTGKTGSWKIEGTETDGSHKITGTSAADTVDYWHADMTLVNLDRNQQYNTNKTVVGTLVFANGTCD